MSRLEEGYFSLDLYKSSNMDSLAGVDENFLLGYDSNIELFQDQSSKRAVAPSCTCTVPSSWTVARSLLLRLA